MKRKKIFLTPDSYSVVMQYLLCLAIILGFILYSYLFTSFFCGIKHYNWVLKNRYIWEEHTTFEFFIWAFFSYGFKNSYKDLLNNFSNTYISKYLIQFIIFYILGIGIIIGIVFLINHRKKLIQKFKAKKEKRKQKQELIREEKYKQSNEYKIEQLQKELEQLKKEKEKEQ